MDRRKLVHYLILNAFVSACVTGTILFWYDRNYRAVARTAPSAGISNPGGQVTTAGAPLDNAVEISSVIGAGTLEAEVAIVKFKGEGQLDLAGWQLKDPEGNTFTFPPITLYTNGAVQVHTASGADTVIDLHWGAGQPVWQSGEDARLLDAQGNLRAVYRVP